MNLKSTRLLVFFYSSGLIAMLTLLVPDGGATVTAIGSIGLLGTSYIGVKGYQDAIKEKRRFRGGDEGEI